MKSLEKIDELSSTHKPMFDIIRGKNPLLPIIIMSAPPCSLWKKEEQQARKAIIKATYDAAIASGDENIYFIEGDKMYEMFGGMSGTADGCHPNDLGFMCIANHVIKEMEKILKSH